MTKPIDVLADAIGLPSEEVKEIARQVKENRVKLNSCDLHDFNMEMERWWYCSKCGGRVSSLEKIWYEKGIEHASKNTLS